MTCSARIPTTPVSLEEYERLPEGPYRDELARGRVIREPLPGFEHGRITGRVHLLLAEYGERRGLGIATIGMGFLLAQDPPTVHGPDIAFISKDRLPAVAPTGWCPFAPDLAVEVVSRSNRVSELQQKVLDYFEAGTRLVWIVDPRTRTVTVHHSLRDVAILRAEDRLSGAPVIPELDIAVGELFG